MKRKLPIIIIGLALLTLIIFVVISSRDTSSKRETAPLTADTTVLDKEIPVIGVRLEPTEFKEVVISTGILEAWNRTLLSSETGGRILRWNYELGERIAAGKTILNLDNEVAELQWRQAEAALESARIAATKAKKDYDRQLVLYEKGDLSDNMIESSELFWKNAEAGLKAAEASAGLIRRAFDETFVKMPFTGRLSAKLVGVGQSAPPGQPVAEVVQTDPIKLTVALTEADIVKIHPGQEVEISTLSHGGRVFSGRVFAAGAASDITSRLFPVEIAISNPKLIIRPGMAATAKILTSVYPKALVIPQDAVTESGSSASCFFVNVDRAELREIEISQPHEGYVMVTRGASSGDTVITVGNASLRSGQKVILTITDR